jgi:hypothetical protein
MAADAECVRITTEAADESAAGENRAGVPTLRSLASRKESWADVMSDLSDSTDAPDPHSLDEESEEAGSPKSAHHSGVESAGSFEDDQKKGRCHAGETPLTLVSSRLAPPSAEIKFVIDSLHTFLSNCPVLAHVSLQQGGFGSPTTITAELSDTNLNYPRTREEWILEPARQALVASAQSSQSVYMIGYCAETFENFYGQGFKAILGVVPTEEEDKVCWDTWQWGYCSHPASCRCKHPHKQDLTEVSVFLRKPKHR